MHFFIDIRESHSHTSIRTRYAETWVNLWKKYHNADTFSFLIFEGQEKKDSSYITVPRPSWISSKRTISSQKKEIFRSINFSDFSPYDESIPTISHIFDNTRWLYPSTKNMGYWGRKRIENEQKNIIQKSVTTVVPNMFTGNELVELWHAQEEKIEIIPYYPIAQISQDVTILNQFRIEKPYFVYDGTYGNEANIVGLLKGFETYKHSQGGTHMLVLHGYAGEELSHITQMIRAFDLTNSVKFVGGTNEAGREALYKNANGWIYAGSYFGGGPTIELSQTYELPLLLPDIESMKGYTGLKILPNHLEKLGTLLKEFETYTQAIPTKKHEEQAYIRAYEKIITKVK